MIITNVEIAKVIEKKGYDFQKALDSIDAGRTPDQEDTDGKIHNRTAAVRDRMLPEAWKESTGDRKADREMRTHYIL